MDEYETFSTTADVGIRIRGSGYAGLFKSAVKALNLLYFDDMVDRIGMRDESPVQHHHFNFCGDSIENVLVNFLSEAVYLLQVENKITRGIVVIEAGEDHLKADLLTIPRGLEPGLEIKSVTYHNLKVNDVEGMKSAEVIFDV
jgi:SHS2 domain-containing protein